MSPCGVEVAWALTWKIDVRADVGLGERALDGAGAAAAGRVGLGDVVGVGGDAGAEHLGVDPGAAGQGVLLGLEDQHAGALAEHEAVAGGVPGPRDRGRVAALLAAGGLGQRHHVGERRHRQRVDRGLGAAGDDDVGAAEADLVEGQRDRLVAGGAGGDRGVHRGPRADVQADVGGRGVGHQHRDRERRDPARALLLERVVVVEQRGDAADAGGHGDADPLAVEVVLDLRQARVRPGLHGRDHGELGGAVQAAGLDPLEHLGRLDGDPAGDLDRQVLGPVVVEVADAGPSVDQGVPGVGTSPPTGLVVPRPVTTTRVRVMAMPSVRVLVGSVRSIRLGRAR